MAQMVGKYNHERNENLEQYFSTVGVPFIPRKIMLSSSPSLEISVNENGEWTITTHSLLRTVALKFKLGEEYEEHMPGGVTIKSTTVQEGDQLVTVSVGYEGDKTFRTYTFTDTGCIITLKHETSGVEAKRYFKRVAS